MTVLYAFLLILSALSMLVLLAGIVHSLRYH